MLGLQNLFNSADLTPHGFCLLWRPELLWLQVMPDAFIGLSYYSIPLALAYFVSKRRDIAFGWIFWMFAAFILGCGTTHFVDIWTLWYPDYGAQGLVKVATAAISVATAIILWPLIPRLLALPSPAELRRANEALSIEIEERGRLVEALQREMVDHQKTEATLRQSQKMEGLGQLTGGVVHDFNNLLLILQGQLHLFKRRGLVAGNEVQVAAMERAVARGEGLTRQLLSFARRQILEPRVIDLNTEISKLVDLLRRSLRGNIELRLNLSSSVGPIEVDQNEFELALINIAANARDAMPRGGILNITVTDQRLPADNSILRELSGDFVSIAISDSGEGISHEVIDRIFEPFFTTKVPGKGTGLGLAQVYGFARQSGGTVTAVSVPGRGTTITMYLPRSACPPLAGRQEVIDPFSGTTSATLLIVEDNPEVAQMKAVLLEEYGYRVVLAADAEQALSLVMSGEIIDLVFSDIVMPGKLNGIELARALRERFPRLPILLTTGYSTEAGSASQEGFAIVAKPYRAEVLHRAILDLLHRPAPTA
jgi:signal transduction histidine kinase/CheY-like chemotaxis protein